MKPDGQRLILRLAEAASTATFVLIDAGGRVTAGPRQAGLDDIGALAGGVPAMALAPAPDVLLTTATLPPARSRERRLRALPYAVEERLAADLESVHIAAGDFDGSDVGVAVVDRKKLDAWRRECSEAGIILESLTSEALALPWQPETRTLLVEQGRSILRFGRAEAISVEHGTVPLMLERTRDAGPIRVFDYTGSAPKGWFSGQRGRREQVAGDPLALLAQHASPPAIELLQGDYAPAHRRRGIAAPWRRAAAVAGACVISYLLYATVDWWRLDARSVALQERAATIYREATGVEGSVPDAERQFRSWLALQRGENGGRGSAFLSLLAVVAPAVAASDELRMESLAYRDGDLELAIVAPTVAAVDRLRRSLAGDTGLQVELIAATADAGAVSSRLRVSR